MDGRAPCDNVCDSVDAPYVKKGDPDNTQSYGESSRELDFPYILKVKSDYPDAVVIDKSGEAKTIEFELFASNFIDHKHDPDKCDYIICWENDLVESEDRQAKALERKIMTLKERLGEIEE